MKRRVLRADYWKSQARKYCDFCKCWISDNKPSIQFHENGKKHKANVVTRLKEISKKSVADQKAKQRMDDDIKKMEEAAMKAYMRDAEQNLDYSAKVMKGIDDNKPLPTTYIPPKDTGPKWHEAKSDDGDLYYWNSSTGESIWEKPSEGYVPLSDKSKKGPKPPKPKKHSKSSGKRKGDHKSDKFKKRKKEDDSGKKEIIAPVFKPIITGAPYGKWEAVPCSSNTVPQPKEVIVDEVEKPKLEFKEKVLPESCQNTESSSSSCTVQFKKPKFRGNMRQRNDLL